MLEISEMAREKLTEHIRNSESDLAVRVTVTSG